MTLEKEQEDQVRKQVIEQFGEDCVKRMDIIYMEINDIRMSAETPYDFLEKVKTFYAAENTDLLLAGILYGMKMGELGYEYHLKQLAEQAEEAEQLELRKLKEDEEEELKRKKLEAEWEAADLRRKAFSEERDYQ